MKLPLAIFLATIALPAFAEPGYFRVTGVASDDTLNVRAAPSASSADIGDLPPDAGAIEVLRTDPSGKWGQIIWQESMGWIATRFLAEDDIALVNGTNLPVGLICSGTEPFWSLRLSSDYANYSDLNGAAYAMGLQGARVALGRADFPVQIGHAGTGANSNALIGPAQCSDGMSDRTYPWRIDLLLSADGAGSYQVGCCHLPLDVGFH